MCNCWFLSIRGFTRGRNAIFGRPDDYGGSVFYPFENTAHHHTILLSRPDKTTPDITWCVGCFLFKSMFARTRVHVQTLAEIKHWPTIIYGAAISIHFAFYPVVQRSYCHKSVSLAFNENKCFFLFLIFFFFDNFFGFQAIYLIS